MTETPYPTALISPAQLPGGTFREYAGLTVAEAIQHYRRTFDRQPEAIFTHTTSEGKVCVWIEIEKDEAK